VQSELDFLPADVVIHGGHTFHNPDRRRIQPEVSIGSDARKSECHGTVWIDGVTELRSVFKAIDDALSLLLAVHILRRAWRELVEFKQFIEWQRRLHGPERYFRTFAMGIQQANLWKSRLVFELRQ
jgi:hypothetical protein